MRDAIWYHLYNLKNVKSNTPPWVFFTFFKFYKRYQILQWITYVNYAATRDGSRHEGQSMECNQIRIELMLVIASFSDDKCNSTDS